MYTNKVIEGPFIFMSYRQDVYHINTTFLMDCKDRIWSNAVGTGDIAYYALIIEL